MTTNNLLETLHQINERPACWSAYTAEVLWNDPHISSKMLEFHLNEEVDPASRNKAFLDRSAAWIIDRFNLSEGATALDLGCGPGLYTTQFAQAGATVTGVDFSKRSIAHARKTAEDHGLAIDYVLSNYLDYTIDRKFDLITMIYCDFCALNPEQRKRLLAFCRDHLSASGKVLLDVFTLAEFDNREETSVYGYRFMDGFWSPGAYYGFLNRFKYDREKVVLDKYTNVEADRSWEVYNWLQYFSPDSLRAEFQGSGFEIIEQYANVAGDPYDEKAPEMAVVAQAG